MPEIKDGAAPHKEPLSKKISRAVEFLTFGIWTSDIRSMPKFMAACYALLRAAVTTVTGIMKNRIPIQAASLSYTTLLALGPIVAVVVIFSGMVFREKGDRFVYDKIVEAMVFVMPAVNEVVEPVPGFEGQSPEEQAREEEAEMSRINPEILALIEKISKGSTSLGIVGTLTVVLTCLLLCVNMESAFNTVWGVSKGRKWVMRFTFYWMLITLGVVLGLSGMTFLTGSQLGGIFKNIPVISEYSSWGTQLIGMGALVVALAMFYKFMPNTHVRLVPALVGAAAVTCLLLANNKLSFLYIGKVMQHQNFYGYLAIVPVAMFSLYIFWLFILTGAQITYAVQNIDFLASSQMWKRTGFKVRELIALAIYSEIAKAFYGDAPSPTLRRLCDALNIPKEIAKAGILALEDKGLICSVEEDEMSEPSYKPSHSPDSLTLSDFFKTMGENDGDEIIERDIACRNATAAHAVESFSRYASGEYAKKTIRELLS